MSEHDEERAFEDDLIENVDLGVAADDVAEGDLSDAELVQLFSSFDDVHASEELKASTLSAIFASRIA